MLLSQKKHSYHISQIWEIIPDIQWPALVYLYGEVWAGKTTFVSHFLAKNVHIAPEGVTSPTYVYYNRYDSVIHFDLYRLENYDTFISIWGEEIIEQNTGIIFIEWPEILEPYIIPDIKIFFSHSQEEENTRNVTIEYYKV